MKKLFFILILIAESYCADYAHVKETFKSVFYHGQAGLMDQKHYYQFIDPYFQRAEKELRVVQYFMTNPDEQLCKDYCNNLFRYTVAHFHNYVSGNDSKRSVDSSSLERMIAHVKEKKHLPDLNAQQELSATIQLLEESNKAYYKKLSIIAKTKIFFVSYFLR